MNYNPVMTHTKLTKLENKVTVREEKSPTELSMPSLSQFTTAVTFVSVHSTAASSRKLESIEGLSQNWLYLRGSVHLPSTCVYSVTIALYTSQSQLIGLSRTFTKAPRVKEREHGSMRKSRRVRRFPCRFRLSSRRLPMSANALLLIKFILLLRIERRNFLVRVLKSLKISAGRVVIALPSSSSCCNLFNDFRASAGNSVNPISLRETLARFVSSPLNEFSSNVSLLFPLRSIVSNFFSLLNACSGIELSLLFFSNSDIRLGSLFMASLGNTSNVQLLTSSSSVAALIPLNASPLIVLIGLLLNYKRKCITYKSLVSSNNNSS